MKQGWIKLFRTLLDDSLFSSEKGLKVWIWCLLKATHTKQEFYIDRQHVRLSLGQFIFGREKASLELNMSASTVWFWMKELEKRKNIDIKSTNKFSTITIKNWDEYQRRPQGLTTGKKQMDTYKNDKE